MGVRSRGKQRRSSILWARHRRRQAGGHRFRMVSLRCVGRGAFGAGRMVVARVQLRGRQAIRGTPIAFGAGGMVMARV